MTKYLFLLCCCSLAASSVQTLELQGLPLQIAWQDLDRDGDLDLIALMVLTRTEGEMDTWLHEGSLRGVYQDKTNKEKRLLTYIQDGNTWRQLEVLDLGKQSVLAFDYHEDAVPLHLWRGDGLASYALEGDSWVEKRLIPTPGLLAGEPVYTESFPFLQRGESDFYWLVPDLEGLYTVSLSDPSKQVLIEYPDMAIESNEVNKRTHVIERAMPRFLNLDGQGANELVFQAAGDLQGWRLGDRYASFNKDVEGHLVDLDGDGLLDVLQSEADDDIDGPRDLPKLKTKIKTYLATDTLTFQEKETADQDIPGLMLTGNDSDIELAPPFLDINSDGREDLTGLAFKISVFQMIKGVTTGRITIKFLLNLSVQKEDGTFRTLAGGPFEMRWKINIRRLRMPSFATIAADFDGDGWMDILMEKKNRLEVTPVTAAGIQQARSWKQKIPKGFKEPDQFFGKDLNNDNRAEFVILKLDNNRTRMAIVEHQK